MRVTTMLIPRIMRLTVFALMAAATACQTAPGEERVLIKPTESHQTIDGWEFVSYVWEYDKPRNAYSGVWLKYRNELIDGVVNEAGLNRLRLEVRSGIENPVDYWSQYVAGTLTYRDLNSRFYEKINDNDDPHSLNSNGFQWSILDFYVENLLLPMRVALEARGEKLYVVLNYIDFKRPPHTGDISHSRNPEEYAEFIEAAFVHLQDKYGFTPDALEIVLEPENTVDWWGGRIADGMVAVIGRLDALGIKPDYIAPSTSLARSTFEYFDDFAKNQDAMDRLSVLSYHRYEWGRGTEHLPKILELAESNGLKTAMLELDPGTIKDLFEDMTLANATAWSKYGIPYDPISDDPDLTGKQELSLIDDFTQLSVVFRNVRRGAVRLGTATQNEDTLAMAFRNIDGSHAIFILTEYGDDIVLEGVPEGEYALSFSTPNETTDLGTITVGPDGMTVLTAPLAGLLALSNSAMAEAN